MDVNDSFLTYTKYTKEEVRGKGVAELNIFAIPDDRERYLEKLLKDGYLRDFEFEYKAKDGTTGYALAYASILDIRGEKCVLTHSYPINARKQLELITTAINSASEAIYIVASSTQIIIYVNDAACDMLGYTKEELLSMKIRDIDTIHLDKDLKNVENRADYGEKFAIETQHKRKDGTIIDVEVKVSAFQFGGKNIGISVIKNITDEKKTRLALEQSEEAFRAIVENSPDVIIRFDLEGNRTYINPRGLELMDKPLEDIIGKHPDEYSPLPELEKFKDIFAQTIKDKKETIYESSYRLPDGTLGWGEQRLVPELDSKGKVVSLLLIGRDFSHLRKS